LVHAARFAADLSYLPLMLELQQRYEGKLRIQTVVSRESVPGSHTLIVLSGIYGCLNDDNKETCDMAYQTVNPANNQLIKEYPPHT
ncbi:hypothetical protein MJM04_30490, partial [Salmonella enterica subsp. enterica serovar Cerro]|nr:hypothetical protein [Salmonella enterica subsp. enterica serovar Cerro]